MWKWTCDLLDRLCGLTDVDADPPRLAGEPDAGSVTATPVAEPVPVKRPRMPRVRLTVTQCREGWYYTFRLPGGRRVGEVGGKPYSTRRNAIAAARRLPGYAACAVLVEK